MILITIVFMGFINFINQFITFGGPTIYLYSIIRYGKLWKITIFNGKINYF